MNKAKRRLASILTLSICSSSPFLSIGCDTRSTSPSPVDDDIARVVNITGEDIEALEPGETIELDVESGHLFEISADALSRGAARIVLKGSEGDVTVEDWQRQSRDLGVVFEPDRPVVITGDPHLFGTLTDAEIQVLEEQQYFQARQPGTSIYWCLIFIYGCSTSE